MLEYVAISKKNCVANLRILQVKTNAKPRRVAKKFLESISTEVYLQMAMMADAADEEIRILRRFDKSQMDMSAAQTTCLTTFAQRLQVLFVQKTATSSGYTQHASRQH